MALNKTPSDPRTRAVLGALQDGLALVPEPYAELAARAGVSPHEVVTLLAGLQDEGVIKRLGVVVRHHELGYTANAMVVFDLPDDEVDRAGAELATRPGVTLCYRRRRQPPQWPYNLFCMVHGRDRATVRRHIETLRHAVNGLQSWPFSVLFSTRRFKQCGARPLPCPASPEPGDD